MELLLKLQQTDVVVRHEVVFLLTTDNTISTRRTDPQGRNLDLKWKIIVPFV